MTQQQPYPIPSQPYPILNPDVNMIIPDPSDIAIQDNIYNYIIGKAETLGIDINISYFAGIYNCFHGIVNNNTDEDIIVKIYQLYLPVYNICNIYDIILDIEIKKYTNKITNNNNIVKYKTINIPSMYKDSIYRVLSFGGQDVTFCFHLINGKLVICRELLDLLSENVDDSILKNIVDNILTTTSEINNSYKSTLNLNDINKNDIIIFILNRLMILLHKLNITTMTKQELYDMVTGLVTEICISDNNSNIVFDIDIVLLRLLNTNELYKKFVKIFLNNIMSNNETYFNKGFLIGSTVLNAFVSVGYKYNYDNNTWYKDVDIVPKYFYFRNNLYKLPDNFNNEFRITRIEIPSNSFKTDRIIVMAIGKHPNVSSNNIMCLGDYGKVYNNIFIQSKDINTISIEFSEFIGNIEDILVNINYDSAYIHITPELVEYANKSSIENIKDKIKRVGVEKF